MERTYARIQPIVEGSGLSFKVLHKNKVLEMFLVLVSRASMFTGETDYEYIYMDKKKSLYTTGCYTGGNTRFGSNDIKPVTKDWYKSYTIVATDIKRINSMAVAEGERAKKAKDAYNKRMESVAVKINALPRKFKTGVDVLDDAGFRFVRVEATYRPSYSSSVQGASIYLENTKEYRTIYLNSYISSDKKMLVRKFESEKAWNFAGALDKCDSKHILMNLLNRRKELERMVNTIKQSA